MGKRKKGGETSEVKGKGATEIAAPPYASTLRLSPAEQEKFSILRRQQRYATFDDAQWDFFLLGCRERGLCPIAGEIFGSLQWDFATNRREVAFITSIGGMFKLAHDTKLFAGNEEVEFFPPEARYPHKARATVWRKVDGVKEKFVESVLWQSCCPVKDVGLLPDDHPWKARPDTCLKRCAYAAVLRVAFAGKLTRTYVVEELDPSRQGHPPMTPPAGDADDGPKPGEPSSPMTLHLALKDEFGIEEGRRNAIIAASRERLKAAGDTPKFYAMVYRLVKARPEEFGGAAAVG